MNDLEEEVVARLRRAGLRPTRQRRALAHLLFAAGRDAVTAESLHAFAAERGVKVSLATVYGTLHSFEDVGLVREISIDARRYFDINPDNHQYFYFEDEKRLASVTPEETGIRGLPRVPAGRAVSRIDVVVRLKPA